MNRRFLLMLLGWVSSAGMAATSPMDRDMITAGDHFIGYSGTATAVKSTQFLYGEQHVLRYNGNRLAERVVLYTCRDGHPFARKTLNYVNPWAPDFLLEDAADGLRQGVRTTDTGRLVFIRGDARQAERTAPLLPVNNLVVDAGFDEFVRTNWRALMAAQSMPLRFLVPSRLQAMSFQVQHVKSTIWQGIAVEVFHLKLAGPLGWVLPGIDASYGTLDQGLVHYEGITDLRDSSGENYRADIDFRPSDRSSSDALHELAAKQAPLTAC